MIEPEKEDEIYLNEVCHKYYHIATGRELVSVTNCFERIGIVDFSKVPFDIIEPARIRGDMVHEMAQYYGLEMLDEESVDMSMQGYLKGIKKYFRENVKSVVAIEKPVFSLDMGVAGTPDILYQNFEDDLCLDDYKTPLKLHPACRLQTAAYAELYWKMTGRRVKHRNAVQLLENGEYYLDPHRNPLRHDLNDFMTVYRAALLKIKMKIQ